MTERHAGYLVTLAQDIREDDSEAVMAAIAMVKGVVTVEPVPADITLSIATDRATRELQSKLMAVFYPIWSS